MNNFDFIDRDGSSPITEEQRKGLKHDINLQGELDELEAENITIGLCPSGKKLSKLLDFMNG